MTHNHRALPAFTSAIFPTAIAVALTLWLSACQPKVETPAPATTPAPAAQVPSATLQELMQAFVDPSADAIWESVSTTITKDGVEEKQPRTDAEWLEVRLHALRLVESANLLAVPGRAVVTPGQKLEDHTVDGISTPEQIHTAIESDRAAWGQFVQGLRVAAQENLTAITQRNIQGMLDAGQRLDAACESCHSTYWYPHAKTPWSKQTLAPAAK